MASAIGISASACAADAQLSHPMPSPPVGCTAVQLTTDHGDVALQVAGDAVGKTNVL